MGRISLDDRDLKILAILQKEGRITKAALAERVNLSPTPCWERLKRLEDQGLIRGYHAEVALDRIAPHVTVFVAVELESHRTDDFRLFEQAVARREEIVACWAIGGGFDYLLQIVTTDINSYQRLIDALLGERIGMKRYFTYIVTKDVKSGTAPPLHLLLGGQTI
jgi:Lrp/AsnC family transcriptional regulator of ectoine degradation